MSDLIRRDEAVQMLDEYIKPFIGLIGDMGSSINGAREIVKSIPTVEPKVGKWIRIGYDIYECSECHQYVKTSDIDAYDWCHHCGAKMERSE